MGFITPYRRKVLYGQLRQYLGEVCQELARQKESQVEEGHLQADHVHMLLSIPPKYAVAQVVGSLKGKQGERIKSARLTVLGPSRHCPIRRASGGWERRPFPPAAV